MPDSPKEHKITTQRTARIQILGKTGPHIMNVWIVLHGYGMLSTYFIRKFQPILSDDTLIIAVEGLSRFYLDGTDGRVGASWMTKEDRGSEIQDQKTYFSNIEQYINELNLGDGHRRILFGFSQGGATAWRQAKHRTISFSHFVLWGSGIPSSDLVNSDQFLKGRPSYAIFNSQDQFINRDDALKFCHGWKQYLPSLNVFEAPGKHHVEPSTLLQISNQIASK